VGSVQECELLSSNNMKDFLCKSHGLKTFQGKKILPRNINGIKESLK
jgi:hypothetical protein